MHCLTQKKLTIHDDEGYFISDGNENLVYFPLKSLIFKVSPKAAHVIQEDTKSHLLNELTKQIENELIKVNKHSFSEAYGSGNKTVETNALGIALTTTCNLSCSYCHANACNTTTSMDEDIINSAISLVFNKCKENKNDFYLIFTGSGEPTVNWEGLQKTLHKTKGLCDSYGIRLHTIMSTNGFYGDNKRKYICDNFSRISLSLDGPCEIHDENRSTQAGKGSFSTVFSTGEYFFREKLPFGIRATVSQKGVGNMLSTYEFFQENFPGITVAFEPLIRVRP